MVKGTKPQKLGPGRDCQEHVITLNRFGWPRLSLLLPCNTVPMETCFLVSKGSRSQIQTWNTGKDPCALLGCEVTGARWGLSQRILEKPHSPGGLDACILCLLHRWAGRHLHGRDNHETGGDRAGDGENPASPGSPGPTGIWAQVYVSAWGKWPRKGRSEEGEAAREPDIYCLWLCARHILTAASRSGYLWYLSILLVLIPVCSLAQSCPTLCDPRDCNLLGSSVHGILQARNTGVAFLPPDDLPNPRIEPAFLASPALAGGFFTSCASWDALFLSI